MSGMESFSTTIDGIRVHGTFAADNNLTDQEKHDSLVAMRDEGLIPLPGGWSLVKHKTTNIWHVCSPKESNYVWVAQFWDGPKAGEKDVLDLAKAIYEC